ncbi:MAG: GNAT family N-acetyltransferase [Ideonella sp.]
MNAPHGPTGELALRDAVPEDALCLSVLAMQVFLDTYATAGIRPLIAREALSFTADSFRRFVEDRQARTVIAERDGQLIGFAQLRLAASHPLIPDASQAELLRPYVQRPFTGSGTGALLLHRVEAIAAESGAAVLWLTAWAHNGRALGFYARLGYRDHGLAWHTFEDESHENRVLARPLIGRIETS